MSMFGGPVQGGSAPFTPVNPSGVDPNAAMGQIADAQRGYLQRLHETAMQERQLEAQSQQQGAALSAQRGEAAADRGHQEKLMRLQMDEAKRVREQERKDERFYRDESNKLATMKMRHENEMARLAVEKETAVRENRLEAVSALDAEIDARNAEMRRIDQTLQKLDVVKEIRHGLFSKQNVDGDGGSLGAQMLQTIKDQHVVGQTATDQRFLKDLETALTSTLRKPSHQRHQYLDETQKRQARVSDFRDTTRAMAQAIASHVGVDAASQETLKIEQFLWLAEEAASSESPQMREEAAAEAAKVYGEILTGADGQGEKVSQQQLNRALWLTQRALDGEFEGVMNLGAAEAEMAGEETGQRVDGEVVKKDASRLAEFERVKRAMAVVPTLRGSDGAPVVGNWADAERNWAAEMRQGVLDAVTVMMGEEDLAGLAHAMSDWESATGRLREMGETDLAMILEDFDPRVRQVLIEDVYSQLSMFAGKGSKYDDALRSLELSGFDLGGLTDPGSRGRLENRRGELTDAIEDAKNRKLTAGARAGLEVDREYEQLRGDKTAENIDDIEEFLGRDLP